MERVTNSEYKRRLAQFIEGLTPRVEVGMYNLALYLEKIRKFKEGFIIVNNK